MQGKRLLLLSALVTYCNGSESPPPDPCSDSNCTPVFYPGLNGSKCYRIPSIIKTYAGTLLAFAENRLDGCGDQGTHDLVVRRSIDAGRTWGPLVTVFVGVTPCQGCPAAVSNPNPVEVTFANGTRAVMLAFDTMNNPSASHHGLDMTTWSFDDGITWGATTTLDFAPEANVGALIGPATGLQAPDGTLFVWITTGFLIISRDHGKSWMPSQRTPGVGGECSIAFATEPFNGTIIMNCRHAQNHRRAQLFWTPSGDTYVASNPTFPEQFTDPGCQGSIINAAGTLFTSNAGSTSGRSQMTIHRSTDHGASWSVGQVLHEGPSAYSQLVGLNDDDLGVLFEAGTTSPYNTISFTSFQSKAPTPRPSQHWTHAQDGTLTSDGENCLDWTSKDGSVYMNKCNPSAFEHQQWKFVGGALTSGGAGSKVLDWTSKLNPDGGHKVYMNVKSSSLPHQMWHLNGQILTADGGDGLCLDWLPSNTVEMRACTGMSEARTSTVLI